LEAVPAVPFVAAVPALEVETAVPYMHAGTIVTAAKATPTSSKRGRKQGTTKVATAHPQPWKSSRIRKEVIRFQAGNKLQV